MSNCAKDLVRALALTAPLLNLVAESSAGGAAFPFDGDPVRTQLDVRVTPLTNQITPVSMTMTNGRGDVVVLGIRVENRSTETIKAKFAPEWFGGMWASTDLRVASRSAAAPPDEWLTLPAFLVGEKDSITKPTVWEPGGSHDFAVRLNWRGTVSKRAPPLIPADTPGKYALRVTFRFSTTHSYEFFESPPIEVELLRKPK